MNRRGFLRGLAVAVAAIAVERGVRLQVSETPPVVAPGDHPLFRGEMGRYDGITLKKLQRAIDEIRDASIREPTYFLLVPPRMVDTVQRACPGTRVRPSVRLRQGGWT